MSKATEYKKALMALNKNQAAREYNKADISPAQMMIYLKDSEREREALLKKFGGTLVIAEGDEEKSPLLQRRKYVFDDGSEWMLRDEREEEFEF